jgi:iron(II)-dependent oxidoreductase
MRSANVLESMRAHIGPMGLACGSAFMKFPEWLGGAISSTCAAAFPKPIMPLSGERTATITRDPVDQDIDWSPELGPVESLVDEMLKQNRYALLLRPQLVENLSVDQLMRTRAALADGMCLVPEGQVVLHRGLEVCDGEAAYGTLSVHVSAFYLDRYPVTNAQFHDFVASGGYEQMAIWDQEIWPAVLDFVDQSGHPGPRYWHNGRYPRGEAKHPVVGVSWYEAAAYSRWAGKRLVTDAEWIKAGSWPVALEGHPLLQRRYPWGEAMDRARANLWGSGPGRTVSVEEFPGGVSVGGVQQLIGNVWEWTADAFGLESSEAGSGLEKTHFKSLRGGAFDTYLDTQATCHFQSGDRAMARKHNIGFRSAINLGDLVKRDACSEDAASEPDAPLQSGNQQ